MEFKEALDLLREKVFEGHGEVGVKVCLRSDGTEDLVCEIYVRGRGVFIGTTFNECFSKMAGMTPGEENTLPGDDFLAKGNGKRKQGADIDMRQTKLNPDLDDDMSF